MKLDILIFALSFVGLASLNAEDFSQKDVPVLTVSSLTAGGCYPFNYTTVKQYDYRVGSFTYPWPLARAFIDGQLRVVGYFPFGPIPGGITPSRISVTADGMLENYYNNVSWLNDGFACVKYAWNGIYGGWNYNAGSTSSGLCAIYAMAPDNNTSPFIMFVMEGGGYGWTASGTSGGSTWSANFSGGGWNVSNKFSTKTDGYIRAWSGQQAFGGTLTVDGADISFDASSGNNSSNLVNICYLPAGNHVVTGSGYTWDTGGGSSLGFFVTNQTQDSMTVADTPSAPAGFLGITQSGTHDAPTIAWSVQ